MEAMRVLRPGRGCRGDERRWETANGYRSAHGLGRARPPSSAAGSSNDRVTAGKETLMETGNQELSSHPDQQSSSAPQTGSGVATRRYWELAQPWVSLLARLGLAGVLMFSAYTKLPPPLSVQSVEAYQLFPDGVNTFLGYTLPLFEFALAALLLLGLATRYVAAVTGVLMVVFIAGIISAWARGLTIDCGCFGSGGQVAAEETAYGWDIARDIGFMALAGIIMLWPRSPFAIDRLVGLYR